jgi:4-hydroxy-tetrahydrodipicolinate synthase
MTHTSPAPLRGVIAAIATPVAAELSPDHDRFVSLARYLLDSGCDGLNMLGTTGEATSFSITQRHSLMHTAARHLPLARLMVGTGAAAVEDAVFLTRAAAELGFAGALVLPPFYYKGVSEAGVISYLDQLIAATEHAPIPIYLYNFPALSGVRYEAKWVADLLDRHPDRIAGLKDSSGDLDYARQIAAISSRLAVFPSNEATLIDARSGLWAGCISATANLNSGFCARAYANGDEAALQTAIAIRKLFDGRMLIPAIKQVLAHVRGDAGLATVVPPLDVVAADQVGDLIDGFQAIVARG